MTQRRTGLLAAIVFLSVPAMSFADALPKGAQPANPQKVASAYVGKTDLWDTNCNGGIYFSANSQVRAWCSDNSNNLGAGTWSVDDQGRLCHQLTWYWPNGSRAGSSIGDRSCISHVVDRFGKLWRSWPSDPEWWPMGRNSSLVKGYKFQSDVRQTRENLGL